MITKNNIKDIWYTLTSILPVSKRAHSKYCAMVLDVLSAQREMQMMTHQNMITLATKVMKFHEPGTKDDAAEEKKKLSKDDCMFG